MLHLHHPNVNKYCQICYRLNDDGIFIRLVNDYAWWTRCAECREPRDDLTPI